MFGWGYQSTMCTTSQFHSAHVSSLWHICEKLILLLSTRKHKHMYLFVPSIGFILVVLEYKLPAAPMFVLQFCLVSSWLPPAHMVWGRTMSGAGGPFCWRSVSGSKMSGGVLLFFEWIVSDSKVLFPVSDRTESFPLSCEYNALKNCTQDH